MSRSFSKCLLQPAVEKSRFLIQICYHHHWEAAFLGDFKSTPIPIPSSHVVPISTNWVTCLSAQNKKPNKNAKNILEKTLVTASHTPPITYWETRGNAITCPQSHPILANFKMQEIGPGMSTVALHYKTASVAALPQKRKNPKQRDIVFAEQQDSHAQSM